MGIGVLGFSPEPRGGLLLGSSLWSGGGGQQGQIVSTNRLKVYSGSSAAEA